MKDGIPVIVDLNEAACAIHGYSRDELLGKPISFLDNADTKKNIPARVRRVMDGSPETFTAQHTCKDGKVITVEVTATPVVVADKKYIYAIERDVTARQRQDDVLRNYERIIATSREHMSLIDHCYVYRAVNDAYLEAHNHQRQEIVGQNVAAMLGRETFENMVKDRLDRCLAGEEVRYQGWFKFSGIGRRFMDVAYYPVVEPEGAVSGVVVNSRDLTLQHEAEEALQQVNEKLEVRVEERTAELKVMNARLQEEIVMRGQIENDLRQARHAAEAASLAKSAFLANMSHELRTPLNAVVGFAAVLNDGMVGPVTSDQQEYLGDIIESSHQLLGLINDILELSLLETERKAPKLQESDLGLLFDVWLEPFRKKAKKNNHSLVMKVDPAVGTIMTNPHILQKVLGKILENAIKFTPSGGSITITASKQSKEMRVTVQDTGIGMDERQMGMLFQTFQQGEAPLNKQYQGIGLGLVLCKKFMEALGGSIEVKSVPGKGSSFGLCIPDING